MVKSIKKYSRDSLYDKDPQYFCEYFRNNLQRGVLYKDICKSLDITEHTANIWRDKYAEFDLAIEQGREPIVETAENKLMKLVQGFSYVVRKKEIVNNGSKGKATKISEETLYCPPNFFAIRFLLLNLKKDKWQSENRIEAQQDLFTLLQNASEKELLEIKNMLMQSRQEKPLKIAKKVKDGEVDAEKK